jgi:hypothetical protein
MIEKRLLYTMELWPVGKTFNRLHSPGADFTQCCGAGSDGLAAQQHRAGPALSFAAAILCAGEVQFIAKNGQQRGFAAGLDGVPGSVDVDCETLHGEHG